ncbi:hypothetical protein TRFO_21662 [Tritrichomonas foetus]|uniref:Uncharacterized protein n=1 Tax=Tritrichomonas foetus TaxID=1144522 RepID=A0A1J4KIC2_9EUKA|nr:hypothetical protein TRFO_21662 [Tritrichomonas foetus]|eukprot:OHT09430.1 hypothetical protein TRFO_21662 [Tritrichomonas foetus]
MSKFDVTFEINRYENFIYDESESLFRVCKAFNQLSKNQYNYPFISCERICPIKNTFSNTFQNKDQVINLENIDVIKDLFICNDRCPVLELQNYNQQKQLPNSKQLIKLLITTADSLPLYIQKKKKKKKDNLMDLKLSKICLKQIMLSFLEWICNRYSSSSV